MNKADRLFIAGTVAPVLRNKPSRRVKTLDSAGNVVRVITDVDVALGVLKRAAIEFDVTDQKRGAHCSSCGVRLCGSKNDSRSTRVVRHRAPRGKHGKCRSCIARSQPRPTGPRKQLTNPWKSKKL